MLLSQIYWTSYMTRLAIVVGSMLFLHLASWVSRVVDMRASFDMDLLLFSNGFLSVIYMIYDTCRIYGWCKKFWFCVFCLQLFEAASIVEYVFTKQESEVASDFLPSWIRSDYFAITRQYIRHTWKKICFEKFWHVLTENRAQPRQWNARLLNQLTTLLR